MIRAIPPPRALGPLGFALTAIFGLVGSAFSQGSEEKTAAEILSGIPEGITTQDTSELVEDIQSSLVAIERYLAALTAATAEDSLVLGRQLETRQTQALATVHELADRLHDQEKKDPAPELRRQVEDALAAITPRLWFHHVRVRDEIDAARDRRAGADTETRFLLEDEIRRLTAHLDLLQTMSLDHLQKLELLGLDATAERARFAELLQERADELSGRLMLTLDRIDELETRKAQSPDANILLLAASLQRNLETNVASMETTLDLMDELQLPTKSYRAQLVTTTKDISSGLLDTGVLQSLLSRALTGMGTWFGENGPSFLVKLLLLFVILFAFHTATKLVRRTLERVLEKSNLNLSRLLRNMIVSTVSNLVMLLGVLIALSQIGISLGPLVAGLGVAGFIIGFALQDTLSNFASGMMILIYRPYDVGDLVEIGGVFGKVDHMSLVSTRILTVDNQTLVVPNSKIWGDVIKNVTDQATRRVDMIFGIDYSDDIPKAERILEEILEEHEKVLDDPEPVVKLHNLGESSVDFIVRPWVAVSDYWDVYWDVTRTVKLRFDEAGISIPFPQRSLHVSTEGAPLPATQSTEE